jgi:hypothetical protein
MDQQPNFSLQQQQQEERQQQHQQQQQQDEWNYDLHRAFVECIFMDGLKACSPSILMEQMHIKAEYITSER